MKKIIPVFIFCLLYASGRAQDLHWSQPSNVLLYLNPAFTGIDAQYSAGLNYRNQWMPAGKPYKTYMAAGDVRLNNNGHAHLCLGGLVNNDVSGDGRYKTLMAGLSLAGLIHAGSSFIGAGMGFNYVQKSLSNDVFSWGNQFDGDGYNSSLSSGEAIGMASHTFFDLSAGVSYKFDPNQGAVYTNGPRLLVGYSASHLTQPNISFTGTDKLPMKHTGYLKAQIPMGEKYALVPMGVMFLQGSMMEITGGLMLHRNIGQVSKITGNRKGAAVSLGLLYRTNSGLIPTLEIERGVNVITVSYDVNAFGFATATRRGGLELALRLRSLKVPTTSFQKHGRPKHGGKWF